MKTTLNRNSLLEIHLPSTGGKLMDKGFLRQQDWQEVTGHHSNIYTSSVFSVAGLVVSRLRASLSHEHVDMLVFLNKNMDLKVDS